MPKSLILGPDGEPVDLAELKRELSSPTVDGFRNVWWDSAALGLTPDGLTDLLREAEDGDADRFLTLAEEMEERDLHYNCVLGDRKRALSGLDVGVEAASDDSPDVKIADALRDVILHPPFGNVTEDLMDALGKSYAVSEIIWDTSEGQWQPKGYEVRDPRWFRFDRETRRELRLKDAVDPLNGVALAPFKFLQHRPRIKAGIPIRNGFARIAGFAWICKLYALKDWMAFAEVFGMPLRLGRYGPNASREDVSILKRAVANIGSDAAAVLPDSMRIEFVQEGKGTSGSGGASVFEQLCAYLDKQMSKAVLGQTMTTDDGASLAQAKVHNEVRLDILQSDAKGVGATLTRDLARPFIDLNFGPQKRYPRIVVHVPEPEDLKQLTDSLKVFVPMGLEVEQSVIRDKLGLPDPDESRKGGKEPKLLSPPAAPPAPEADPPEPDGHARNAQRRALNAAAASDRDYLDPIIDAELVEWQPVAESLITPVEALAAECSGFDEFMSRLPELAGAVDLAELQDALARANFKARGVGDATNPKV